MNTPQVCSISACPSIKFLKFGMSASTYKNIKNAKHICFSFSSSLILGRCSIACILLAFGFLTLAIVAIGGRQRLVPRAAFSDDGWKKMYYLSHGNGAELRWLMPFMQWRLDDTPYADSPYARKK